MKIDEIQQNINLIPHTNEPAVHEKGGVRKQKPPVPEKTDRGGTEVEFSEKSIEFSMAAKVIEKDSAERANLVNEIKTKIENGTYDVDASEIADKIVRSTLTDMMEG